MPDNSREEATFWWFMLSIFCTFCLAGTGGRGEKGVTEVGKIFDYRTSEGVNNPSH